MARIPIQKREGGGFPWWAWPLIGLVVLALLLGLLFAVLGDDEEAAVVPVPTEPVAAVEPAATEPEVSTPEVVPTTPAAAAETPAAAGGPITDLTTIFDEQDKASLAVRQVDLRGETAARVQSVVGDTTFWVGPSQDQQVFAVLSEEQDAAGVEGLVDVNEGQTVRLTGQVQQLPSMEEARQQWGLSETNAAELENQQIYISAEQVEIIQR